MKAFSERFYRKITGAELGPVLETLEYLKHETGIWLELTTLLIPGENDSSAEPVPRLRRLRHLPTLSPLRGRWVSALPPPSSATVVL